jgi:hypothetical protein
MADALEVGMKLHATYTDGEFYPAEVVAVNTKKKGNKPVKVAFVGYSDAPVWLSLDSLKSKKIKKEPEKATAKGKAKAKAKAKPAKVFDYSELEKGARVQAEADGTYYAAEVVTIAKAKAKAAAPVKIHWVGYTAASDEWVGGDRLRSKMLKTVSATEAGKKSGSMPQAARKFLLVKPKIEAPLDKAFRPLILGKKKYLEAAKECTDKLDWALVRSDGVARYTLPVFPEKSKDCGASIYLAGVLIQEMLWQRSASELKLCGPARVVKALTKMFSKGGTYEFEALSMPNVCGHAETPFVVSTVEKVEDLPEGKDSPQVCGKDAGGCRLAFDLGKSDIKTVAVKDNEVVYSKELLSSPETRKWKSLFAVSRRKVF